jgi:hypothetical protein
VYINTQACIDTHFKFLRICKLHLQSILSCPTKGRVNGDICRANEICRESKRQTINADDVLKAVEELDFTEFCEPLNAALAGNQFYLAAF